MQDKRTHARQTATSACQYALKAPFSAALAVMRASLLAAAFDGGGGATGMSAATIRVGAGRADVM